MNQQLINFYRLIGSDSEGRMLEGMWQFKDYTLENCHDYIQWWFPTITRSQFNETAPKIDKEDMILFREDPTLGKNLLHSYNRFMKFLGLENGAAYPKIAKKYIWGSFNHNHLRITRVLESLRVLGKKTTADELLNTLRKMHRFDSVQVSPTVWMHWEKTREWDKVLREEILK